MQELFSASYAICFFFVFFLFFSPFLFIESSESTNPKLEIKTRRFKFTHCYVLVFKLPSVELKVLECQSWTLKRRETDNTELKIQIWMIIVKLKIDAWKEIQDSNSIPDKLFELSSKPIIKNQTQNQRYDYRNLFKLDSKWVEQNFIQESN